MGILESLGLKKAPPPVTGGKTIKAGPRDTLRSLAIREYGDESLWVKIFEANKWRIDGDDLTVGQDVLLPNIPGKGPKSAE